MMLKFLAKKQNSKLQQCKYIIRIWQNLSVRFQKKNKKIKSKNTKRTQTQTQKKREKR